MFTHPGRDDVLPSRQAAYVSDSEEESGEARGEEEYVGAAAGAGGHGLPYVHAGLAAAHNMAAQLAAKTMPTKVSPLQQPATHMMPGSVTSACSRAIALATSTAGHRPPTSLGSSLRDAYAIAAALKAASVAAALGAKGKVAANHDDARELATDLLPSSTPSQTEMRAPAKPPSKFAAKFGSMGLKKKPKV
jgi:hypothetical protein